MSREWPYVEIDVPRDVADAAGSALMDAGSTGIELADMPEGTARLRAFFGEAPDREHLLRALADVPGMPKPEELPFETGTIADDDWLRIWKEGFEPIPIGERLLVVPSWKRDRAVEYPARFVIQVDPGMAFGTGTHETTRLCLEWLDANWRGGSLLDVGTGTGILAIAASVLEPAAMVTACDVDPVAVDVARENAEVNGVADRIRFDVSGPGALEGRFDVVLANLTADVILGIRDDLTHRVCRGGHLVVSGILEEQADAVVAALTSGQMDLVWRRTSGEWTAAAARAT